MHRAYVAAVAVVLAAIVQVSANDQWPQFRGTQAGVAADDPALPDTWSQTENVVWRLDVPGIGWSSPVVWNELVFVYFGGIGLFAFDMNGKRAWSRSMEALNTRYGWGTGASPILHKERIYIVNDNDTRSFIAAFDRRTGNSVWRVDREEGSNW